MKRYIYTPVLVMLLAALITLRAQGRQDENIGLPGDNLNLYAVMKLFQESETLEGFERNLNDENSRINNLDLDGNGYVDYIRVIDNVDKNVHYIVLQVAINARENQDVAVFTVVQRANNEVEIQLIGDEDLYGKNYIIEPIYAETPNPGYNGNARVVNRPARCGEPCYHSGGCCMALNPVYVSAHLCGMAFSLVLQLLSFILASLELLVLAPILRIS